ncbi:MAG: hypothetical protein HPY67_03835 [Syntrophaceae bacterium]|nr:hypothetical protein [Syntrophaceae bacterium]
MTPIECHEMIKTVSAYYERKIPSDRTLDLWFERIRGIPGESIGWIQTRIFEQFEAFPKNLPSVIWELYNAWLDAHPEKRARKESVDCPDCEGGLLCLTRPVRGYRVPPTFSAPCGRCRQVRAAQYMTLAEALRQGYSRVNLHAVTTVKSRNIGELIRSIGREIHGSDEPARLEELNRQASLLRETEEVTNHAEA